MSDAPRGFALLIVLWALVLLTQLTSHLTATAGGEARLAINLRNAAVMEAQADGLVYATLFRLMSDQPSRRGVDGVARAMKLPGAQALVTVASLAGKVNPNTAPEPLLAALLARAGMADQAATALAAAIADWRTPGQTPRRLGAKVPQYQAAGLDYAPPGAPFESVAELGFVLGMTPALLARIAPHMSVFYPGDPIQAAADPVVGATLAALGAGEPDVPAEGGAEDGVYARITVAVTGGNGAAFTRRAEIWAGHGPRRGQYLVLGWGTPAE